MKSKVSYWKIATIVLVAVITLIVILNRLNKTNSSSPVGTQTVISSGGIGGRYHSTANKVCDVINNAVGHKIAYNLTSEGSTDNIQKLRSGVADLVIVQRDVLVDGYYSFYQPLSDISIIAPLFEEAVQIFVAHESEDGIISVREFGELIKSGSISKLAVGPETSTTSLTTKRVIELLGITTPKDFFDHRPASFYIPEFVEGQIDAIAYFASIPVPNLGDVHSDVSILDMSLSQSERVAERTIDLEQISIAKDSYPWLKTSASTVGTWAMLVSRNGAALKYGPNPGEAKNLYNLLESAGFIRKDQIIKISESEGGGRFWAHLNQGGFFRGLPLNNVLEKEIYGINYFKWLLIILIPILAIILVFQLRRNLPKWQHASLIWYKYQHISWVILVGLLLAYLMPEAIFWIERQFCEKYGLQSAILNLSDWEKYTWLLVLASTGYESQGFPLSLPARILASTTVLMYYFLGIFAFAFTYFKIQIRNRMIQGKVKLNWKNHIVVCGWNTDTPKLLDDLVNESNKYIGMKPNVLLIHPEAEKKLADIDLLKQLQITNRFKVMSVEANNQEVMQNACIDLAKSVLLLADSEIRNPDETTLMRALAIGSYCRKKNRKSVLDSIYIIAEVKNPDLRETLLHNDVNEVICGPSVANRIIFQSAFNHGVNMVLDEILDAKTGNEFYIIDVGAERGKNAFLEGLKFEDLSPLLSAHGILLIGIKAKLLDPDTGLEIFDEEIKGAVFNKRVNKPGDNPYRNSEILSNNSLCLNRQIMINPQGDEKNYLIDDNDELFVIADGYDAISTAIDKLDVESIRQTCFSNLRNANNPEKVIDAYANRQKKHLSRLRGIASMF